MKRSIPGKILSKSYRQSIAGIVTNLPPEATQWSYGRNWRFRPGCLYQHPGKLLLATVPDKSPIRHCRGLTSLSGSRYYAVITDLHIYLYSKDFSVVINVTPANFTAGKRWNVEMDAGLPVISNEYQFWQLPSFSSPAINLPNYPVGSLSTTLFDGRLWAVGAYDPLGSYFPARLTWTGVNNPTQWNASPDIGTASEYGRGGWQDLVSPKSGEAAMETGMSLKAYADEMYAFTDKRIWYAQRTASPHDYSFKPLSYTNAQLAAPKAAVAVESPYGSGVCYMGKDNFYVVSGTTVTPFGLDIRNVCFPNLNRNSLETAFAFQNPATFEVFFCVPTGASAYPDTSFVYNMELKNWTICDCNITAQCLAVVDAPGNIPVTTQWQDSAASFLNPPSGGVIQYSLVGDSAGNLYRMDGSISDNGSPISSVMESGDFGDGLLRRSFRRVVPNFRTSGNGSKIFIKCGSRDSLNQPVEWDAPQQFVVGRDKYITSRKSGFYLKIQIYSDNAKFINVLDGYSFEYLTLGRR